MSWLKILELYDVRSMKDGEQIHINHEKCPAGTDTKRRLYIKKDGSTVLAYCHHCNSRGVLTLGGLHTGKGHVGSRKDENASSTSLPKDYERLGTEHGEYFRWVNQYLDTESIQRYHIGYSKYYQRVILPYWSNGALGYQLRSLTVKPKYLTKGDLKNVFWSTSSSESVVIVEDLISAYKIHSLDFNVLCLLGTNITCDSIVSILKANKDSVIIWLDDDNRHIKQTQMNLFFRLGKFFDVRIIEGQKQPKDCTPEEICAILEA